MADDADLVLRLATRADEAQIDEVMGASIRDLFPAVYNERQTASSVVAIGRADRMLIGDGTYFVIEASRRIVGCDGWSRRSKLFSGSTQQEGRARVLDPATEAARVRAMFVRRDWTRRGLGTRILEACESAARAEGFRRLELMATLPGVLLYERFGFTQVSRGPITMPDGIALECVAMEKPIG